MNNTQPKSVEEVMKESEPKMVYQTQPNRSVEEVSLRDFIEEQLYTMLEVTSVMQPKSDKEFIAVALPNLHTK